ncbi:hypothetical protein A33Q_4612 [Indibacter alkaliphilus LW1]|uniref:Uncharacterized protein n=1 Tax=Indibacter alkaliphilus (strain CCUG 57479 / KCTC 22604 / LW1) TaxID=1189612 RepID=S2CY92_INDAL|nr:hypothetical protein A33Q_4612 [Indibacter alkaliphilus LW1]
MPTKLFSAPSMYKPSKAPWYKTTVRLAGLERETDLPLASVADKRVVLEDSSSGDSELQENKPNKHMNKTAIPINNMNPFIFLEGLFKHWCFDIPWL